MKAKNWYGVRTVFEHLDRTVGQDRLYEERIVLIRAVDDDEAIARAEEDAEAYAVDGVRYLGFALSFHMFEPPADMQEVFSLMRDSRMEPKRYLDRFFDTGREGARDVGS